MKQTRHTIQVVFFVAIAILVYGFKFNVEAYCPFGAVETLYTYIKEGKMLCALGTGNFYALGMILLMTLIFRRFFCGYVCPIGATSELMRSLAGDFEYKQLQVPNKIDKGLSLIRYAVLIMVLIMTAATIDLFYRKMSPCYLLASINNDIVFSTYVVGVIFLVGSFLISMPFCRWICPFAVVQNVFSKFGLSTIERDVSECINCGKCTNSCPMSIDVANTEIVKSADCISCFECINSCPVGKEDTDKALSWVFLRKIKISNTKNIIIAAILFGVFATAGLSIFVDIPTFIYTRDVIKPSVTNNVIFEVEGVSCSGSAKLFTYFLDRKDISQISGYMKVTARPRSGWIPINIQYDPAKTDKEALVEAIMEPYYDLEEKRWRPSPFKIKGFNLFE